MLYRATKKIIREGNTINTISIADGTVISSEEFATEEDAITMLSDKFLEAEADDDLRVEATGQNEITISEP
jgi:hypothetical protein